MKHRCGSKCGVRPEFEEIYDRLGLEENDRDKARIEVTRVKGREHKERSFIARYQSTETGKFIIQLHEVSTYRRIPIGPKKTFKKREKFDDFYNHMIDVFGFDPSLKVNQLDASFFEALEEEEFVFEVPDDEFVFEVPDDEEFDFEEEGPDEGDFTFGFDEDDIEQGPRYEHEDEEGPEDEWETF